MRWLAAIAVALVPGCFYVDPINQRPSADIVRDTLTPPVRDGMTPFAVHAEYTDPDGDPMTLAWTASACTAGGCSPAPFASGTQVTFAVVAPTGADITGMLFQLEVTDSHGAVERPSQQLLVNVADQPPTIDPLQIDGRVWPALSMKHPITLPITVSARKSDPDGDPVTLTWDAPYALGTDLSKSGWTVVSTSDTLEVRTFTPDVAGSWSIKVHADDGIGGVFERDAPIDVEPDQPPCLGTTDPQLTTSTIVLDQARRFSVFTVDDDLDLYPTPAAPLGTATFQWSLATPASSGAFVALHTEENNVVIDPADYAPGDVIDVRAEIQDRVVRTSPCDPSTPQCSMTADQTCLQRQTWHLEVR